MYALRKPTLLTVALALMLALLFGVVAMFGGERAKATHVNPKSVAGNPTCSQLVTGVAGLKELKVEPVADGTYSDGTLTVTIDVSDPAQGQVFDFKSNIDVLAVFVKGGPGGNLYDYRPNGVKSDLGLHAPEGPSGKYAGLSHISFCYVPKANPTLVTKAQTPVTIGSQIWDTATLSGGNSPTGTIEFKLYAPGDTNCTGPAVFTSTVNVNVNGSYDSAKYTTTAVGTYRWTAQYSGDAKNNPASSPCNAANEQSVVNKAPSAIATEQSYIPQDKATVTGFGTPTGTVKFELFKSLDCSGTAVFTQTRNLSGGTASTNNNGDPNNGGYTINAGNLGTGQFSWKVTYSGDANNEGSTSCKEESTVTIDNDDTQP